MIDRCNTDTEKLIIVLLLLLLTLAGCLLYVIAVTKFIYNLSIIAFLLLGSTSGVISATQRALISSEYQDKVSFATVCDYNNSYTCT